MSLGTYVAVTLAEHSANKVFEFYSQHKINNLIKPDLLHSTVLFSRRECRNIRTDGAMMPPVFAMVDRYEMWHNPPDSKDNILVAILDCDELITRHNVFKIVYNATHDYDTYIPHMTLSYSCGDIDITKLPLYNRTVKFVYEYSEPLDMSW